jgi:methylphosphotriester-DNA--protein-cysteine methyltransferase
MTKEKDVTKKHGNYKELDWKTLDALLQAKPTLAECADYLGCSGLYIEQKIRKEHDMTFSEYRALKMGRVKISLIMEAIQRAKAGNITILIFCLKNIAGWSDKVENKIEEVPTKELIQQAKDIIATYEKKDSNEQAQH